MTLSTSSVTVADRETWLAARLAHLEREKEFTRLRDDLSRQRRELPWLEVSEDYQFTGPDGPIGLSHLFGDETQLLVYHFMYGPGWGEGCPSCSFWADNFDGINSHLGARDTSLVAVSRGPLDELQAYQTRMGWTFPWYSSAESSFNYDMGVSFKPEDIESGTARYNFGTSPAFGDEMPGISIFSKQTDPEGTERIYLTYQTFSRGLDMLNGAYHMLDLTPKGRDEQDLDFSMAWLRRHDAY
jgi:predicted dithiol-disulfide oxidoreductase (DUF899 family)